MSPKNFVNLYVDRSIKRWVVQDREGSLWIVSSVDENAWATRQPFHPTEETALERVPGHYMHLLGLPTHSEVSNER